MELKATKNSNEIEILFAQRLKVKSNKKKTSSTSPNASRLGWEIINQNNGDKNHEKGLFDIKKI